jgi:thiamine biosynthesis protein ThiS
MTHTVANEPTADSLSIVVNGERREVARGWSLADLLRSLDVDPRMVVVEHNRLILRDRDAYADIALAEDDALELVHFVGGG